MAKKPGIVLDFGVRLRGEMAEVFEKERKNADRQRSEMARDLILEALRARGYRDLKDPVEWGGYRPRKEVKDDAEGQLVAVG